MSEYIAYVLRPRMDFGAAAPRVTA